MRPLQGFLPAGIHQETLNLQSLSPGLYQVVITGSQAFRRVEQLLVQ